MLTITRGSNVCGALRAPAAQATLGHSVMFLRYCNMLCERVERIVAWRDFIITHREATCCTLLRLGVLRGGVHRCTPPQRSWKTHATAPPRVRSTHQPSACVQSDLQQQIPYNAIVKVIYLPTLQSHRSDWVGLGGLWWGWRALGGLGRYWGVPKAMITIGRHGWNLGECISKTFRKSLNRVNKLTHMQRPSKLKDV